jgi:hypothetical protein
MFSYQLVFGEECVCSHPSQLVVSSAGVNENISAKARISKHNSEVVW